MLQGLLVQEGFKVGRLHVTTLMKRMGIEALYCKPNNSKPAPEHKIYPICCESCLSITLEADFCIEAVEDALARHGRPDIFNTDQGSQFTSTEFIKVLAGREIKISMDGKGAWHTCSPPSGRHAPGLRSVSAGSGGPEHRPTHGSWWSARRASDPCNRIAHLFRAVRPELVNPDRRAVAGRIGRKGYRRPRSPDFGTCRHSGAAAPDDEFLPQSLWLSTTRK